MIILEEYKDFVQEFYERGCLTMLEWPRAYNEADLIPFIEVVNKTQNQY